MAMECGLPMYYIRWVSARIGDVSPPFSDRSARSRSPARSPRSRRRHPARASSSRRIGAADKAAEAEQQNRIAAQPLDALPPGDQGQEDHGHHRRAAVERPVLAQQQNYGPAFPGDQRAAARVGLRTFTPEEIRKQIAQAEIDAYFKNDPDAALSASRRLGANFVLRGLIISQATVNPVMRRQPGLGRDGILARRVDR